MNKRIKKELQNGPMKIKKTVSALLCIALLVSLTATPSQLTSSTSTQAASRPPVRGKSGMVSSVSEIASQVGVDVLKRGGNAVDAAVAVGLALAVVWPSAGNLGGGGFMVIRRADGKATAIDYREMAPSAAHRNVYLDDFFLKIRRPPRSTLFPSAALSRSGLALAVALPSARLM